MSHLKIINTNAAFDLLFFSAYVRGRTIKFANLIVRPRKHSSKQMNTHHSPPHHTQQVRPPAPLTPPLAKNNVLHYTTNSV